MFLFFFNLIFTIICVLDIIRPVLQMENKLKEEVIWSTSHSLYVSFIGSKVFLLLRAICFKQIAPSCFSSIWRHYFDIVQIFSLAFLVSTLSKPKQLRQSVWIHWTVSLTKEGWEICSNNCHFPESTFTMPKKKASTCPNKTKQK